MLLEEYCTGGCAGASDLTGDSSGGGAFCNLLVCRCGAACCLGDLTPSGMDSEEVFGGGDDREDSSDTLSLSISSYSSSVDLFFLSFRLNNPLSIFDFFSFFFLSSLFLSPALKAFSTDSKLARPFN